MDFWLPENYQNIYNKFKIQNNGTKYHKNSHQNQNALYLMHTLVQTSPQTCIFQLNSLLNISTMKQYSAVYRIFHEIIKHYKYMKNIYYNFFNS